MKLDMKGKPVFPSDECAIGNVYRCKGGGVTKFWVVVGIRDNTVVCIDIDDEGNITSSGNYGRHIFEDHTYWRGREVLGRCVDMPDLVFNVKWETLP